MQYVALYSMPGCLPEMTPAVFDNASDAWDWLADELEAGMPDDDVTGESGRPESVITMSGYASASAEGRPAVLGTVYGEDGYAYTVDVYEPPEAADSEPDRQNRGGRA